MKTAKVTYNAPAGDSKVVEMGGVTFFDGQSVEINDVDNPHMMVKLQGNQHFTFEAGEDVPGEDRPKRGRPSNADKAAAAAAVVPPTVSPVQ
jgi:hypothetical protein